MEITSGSVVTRTGMGAALAVLAAGGGAVGAGYYWWQGEGVRNPVVVSAGVVGALLAVAVVVILLRATRQRLLRAGWWLGIVPVFAVGVLGGLIVAPFAAADVEAGVFMTLLIGPVVVGLVVWVALWTSFMAVRASRRRTTARTNRLALR